MWPRIEVFAVLAVARLMASAEAQAGPELTSVSGDPGVFHLLDSAIVDGGENGDTSAWSGSTP